MVIYQEVLALVGHDEELVSKFHKFKRNAALARNPNARWCPKYAFCLIMHFREFRIKLSKLISNFHVHFIVFVRLPDLDVKLLLLEALKIRKFAVKNVKLIFVLAAIK